MYSTIMPTAVIKMTTAHTHLSFEWCRLMKSNIDDSSGGDKTSMLTENQILLPGQAQPCTHLTPPVSQPNVKYELAVVRRPMDLAKQPNGQTRYLGPLGHLVVETNTLNIAQQPSDS